MGEYVVKKLVIRFKGRKEKIVVPITDEMYESIMEAQRTTGMSVSKIVETIITDLHKMAKKDKEMKDYWEKVICG
jgi:hypothetical protein